jgi:hypothetical protein
MRVHVRYDEVSHSRPFRNPNPGIISDYISVSSEAAYEEVPLSILGIYHSTESCT